MKTACPDTSPWLLRRKITSAAIECNSKGQGHRGSAGLRLELYSLQCDLHFHPSQSCSTAATAKCLGCPPPHPLPQDAHAGHKSGRKETRIPSRLCIPSTWDLSLAGFKGRRTKNGKEGPLFKTHSDLF